MVHAHPIAQAVSMWGCMSWDGGREYQIIAWCGVVAMRGAGAVGDVSGADERHGMHARRARHA